VKSLSGAPKADDPGVHQPFVRQCRYRVIIAISTVAKAIHLRLDQLGRPEAKTSAESYFQSSDIGSSIP
jgi:hypothetical protein